MRIRNSDATKSATPSKTTRAARKSAIKTTPSPSDSSAAAKRPSTAKAEQVTTSETAQTPSSDSKPQQLAGAFEEVKAVPVVTPGAKVTSGTKLVRRKSTPKTRNSVAAVANRTPKTEQAVKSEANEEVLEVKDLESENKDESAVKIDAQENDLDAANKDAPAVTIKGQSEQKEETVTGAVVIVVDDDDEEDPEEDEGNAADDVNKSVVEERTTMEVELPPTEKFEDPANQKELIVSEVAKASGDNETSGPKEGVEMNEELEENIIKNVDEKEKQKIESVMMEENSKTQLPGGDAQPQHDEYGADEGLEEYGDRVDFGDHDEDDLADEDPEEIPEETETLEEEHRELTAIANERRIKKAHEIFIGGLDRDAREEDIRKVFEKIGEVVEVRLHKNFTTNKNKGYAFVKFANKEHAKRALLEMKNPVICGKRCGTAPSEDNDTLFLGNICNTWTKEAIRQKLKEYGVEGVESITLVPDVQHEGRSRGFAFLDFSCHADAMLAYKRLQKPDVVFGHPERTAKVAFAEPLREPDPEIMAQVKTVFLDGLPPHWDEDSVREMLKGYGEIVRIVLARNMSTAKRKDFGFVDFSTHEAAVVCINSINNKELGDGNSKTKVKARLSNPLPKTQAVKGGMCGGFRIGQSGSGTFPRFGRGFGRAGHQFNWPNFQRGRGFYQRGRGQIGRMGPHDYDFDNRYGDIHGRPFFGRGGRRGSIRGSHHGFNRGPAAGPSRPNFNRPWHDVPDRGRGEHIPHPRRQPFSPEEAFDRPFVERHFEDPYFYDDGSHGMKRPFYMMDQDPDYMEPSRLRPRLDYSDPAGSFRGGGRYRDSYGVDGGFYSNDYYGRDYGAYPSYYGGDRPYGGGYYY